jgi:hypothetical protein
VTGEGRDLIARAIEAAIEQTSGSASAVRIIRFFMPRDNSMVLVWVARGKVLHNYLQPPN